MIRFWVYRESTYERIPLWNQDLPELYTSAYIGFGTRWNGGSFYYSGGDHQGDDWFDHTRIPYNEWFEVVIHPEPVEESDVRWWDWQYHMVQNALDIDASETDQLDLLHMHTYRNWRLEVDGIGMPGDVFYCSPWLIDPSGTMTEWKNGDSEQWGWRPHTWANWLTDPRLAGGLAQVVVDERHYDTIPVDRETTVEIVTDVPVYGLPEGCDRALHVHFSATPTASQAAFVALEQIADFPWSSVYPWGYGSFSAEVLYLGPDDDLHRSNYGLAYRESDDGGSVWGATWVQAPEPGVWQRQELETGQEWNIDVPVEYGFFGNTATGLGEADLYLALPRLVYDFHQEGEEDEWWEPAYVDGDTPGYAWEGTPNASRTVASEGTEPEFSYQDAVTRIRKVGSQVKRVVRAVKRR